MFSTMFKSKQILLSTNGIIHELVFDNTEIEQLHSRRSRSRRSGRFMLCTISVMSAFSYSPDQKLVRISHYIANLG
jgi:hypothetical protein